MTARGPGRARLQALLERAVALHRGGQLVEAVALYREILAAAPRHPDTLHLYGLALHQSGQSRAALAPLEQAVALAGDNPGFRLSLAGALRALGETDRAVEFLQKGMEAAPGDARLPALLGELLAARGDYEAAAEAFRGSLAAGVSTPPLLSNLAAALNQLGRHEEALALLRQALEGDPELVPALIEEGEALVRLGREAEACRSLRKAVELAPQSLAALKGLGLALERSGEPEEALELFRRGLALAPDDAELQSAAGHALQLLGRFEEASAAFERALTLVPDQTDSLVGLAEGRALTPEDDLARRLERNLAETARPPAERANAGFALSLALQRGGAHEKAFAAADRANALARTLRPYDPAAYEAYVDRLIESFDAALFERLAGAGSADPRPVFVVGLPRSGTTLVEQILASHPAVFGAGELTVLPALARRLPERLGSPLAWPACNADLTPAALQELAADYLAAWPTAAAGAERVTDKLPANDHHLGLIALALPRARVICCRRDPRDIALSNYFHFFQRGQGFGHDLGDLARHILAHRRMTGHWQKLLPQVRPDFALLEIELERLVAEPEQEARRLVEHCGLPWDPACLSFHRTERAVTSASHWQVRQPLDRSGIGRWRHYRRQLAPLLEAFAAGGLALPDEEG